MVTDKIPAEAGRYVFQYVNSEDLQIWRDTGKNVRKPDPNRVKKLVKNIQTRGYRHNGNPIRFFQGYMDDGQHRVAALIEVLKRPDRAVQGQIQDGKIGLWTFEAECDAATVDINKPRTAALWLKNNGLIESKNVTMVVAMLRLIKAYVSNSAELNLRKPGDAISGEEAVEMLKTRPGVEESATYIKGKRELIGAPTFFAVMHYLASNKKRKADFEAFIEDVLKGPRASNSAAVGLRTWLKDPILGNSNRDKEARHRAAIIKAWNLWSPGQPGERLSVSWNETSGEKFPHPQF